MRGIRRDEFGSFVPGGTGLNLDRVPATEVAGYWQDSLRES